MKIDDYLGNGVMVFRYTNDEGVIITTSIKHIPSWNGPINKLFDEEMPIEKQDEYWKKHSK